MNNESSRYANEDPLELEDYRPISILAVISLIASLFSFVVIFDLYMTFVPVIGILLAVIAKIRIRRSGNLYLGGSVANLAICICLFCVTWSVAYRYSREYTIVRQARNCTDEWLKKMRQGDVYEMYALTQWYNTRYKRSMDLEQLYTSEPDEDIDLLKRKESLGMVDLSAREKFEEYMADELVDMMVNAGDELEAKFVRPVYINYSDDFEKIGLLYDVSTPNQTAEVLFELDCLHAGDKRFWRIAGVSRPAAEYADESS